MRIEGFGQSPGATCWLQQAPRRTGTEVAAQFNRNRRDGSVASNSALRSCFNERERLKWLICMNVDASFLLMLAGAGAPFFFLVFLFPKGKAEQVARHGPDWGTISRAASKTEFALLFLRPDGHVEWANPAFLRVTGYEAVEVIGKAFGATLLGCLQSAKASQQIKTGLSGRKAFNLDLLCAHKDGHRYWLGLHLCPVLDEHERGLNFIAMASDVSARKRNEDELGRIHRRNELFLNAAGEGIFGLDLQGIITFINPAAARMTRCEPGDLIGKPASAILHQLRQVKRPAQQEPDFLETIYQDGKVLIGEADQFKRKDGAIFPVEYTSTSIREGNNLVGAVFIFRDVTDRKQSESLRSRQTRQFALRADIGFALAGSETLRTLLQRCAQAMVKQLDGAFARIWTLNQEENVLELQASAGIYTRIDGHYSRIPVGDGAKVGLIARDRIPQLTNDLINDPQVTEREGGKG